MKVIRSLLLVFIFVGCTVMISASSNSPNCQLSGKTYRAVGDWVIDAESSSEENSADPLGMMHATNGKSCEYSVDIHGLKVNKQYHWKVVVKGARNVSYGCTSTEGSSCRFTTSTGSIRLKIMGSFAYRLTAKTIGRPAEHSATLHHSSRSISSKKVFAHYMVGFAYGSDQSFFDAQIKKARTAGIDGFALNVGSDDWQPDRVAKALDAAKNNGNFVMFISFDMSSLGFDTGALSRFQSVAHHPSYFKVDGRPFFSTFAGENQDNFWSQWKSSSGLNPYFCPSWPNYPTSNLLQSHPVADCIFTWNAWPAKNSGPGAHFDVTGDRNLLASARATGKKYMAPLAPWFYTHVSGQGWSKNWIFGSETLLPERWKQIISLQPDFVEIITWNDYSESSYMCSISSDLPTSMTGITDMITNPQKMNHDGWLQLSKHYIQWYKHNARPAVTMDQFYWWYRIHPKNNVNGEAPDSRNDAQDCVVVHSIVKNVRPNGGYYTIIVDLNGSKQNYRIVELDQTKCIPFSSNPGYVTISMTGPDNKVWWAEGKNVPQQSSGNNFNAFVNSYSFRSP
jgi:glucan endo-1,3-alpha-glucosidase